MERLKKLLAGRHRLTILDRSRAPSAVLIPVFVKDGAYHILFIQRSDQMETHKGQMAFPGGTHHAEDGDLLNTALREAEEEVGLRSEDVEVIGRLDDQFSVASNFVITPFVGLIPYPYDLKIDGVETQGVFDTPVRALLREGHIHDEILIQGPEVTTSYYYHCGDRIVWGATARILNQFLELCTRVGIASQP